ncbi:MAG: hypothetical protein WC712_03090 [Candidatus Brocadiia bacterium]
MRKVLLIVLVLIVVAMAAAFVIYSLEGGSDEQPVNVEPGTEFTLSLKMPVGERLVYDVDVIRSRKASSGDGQKIVFTSEATLVQVMTNVRAEDDKSFTNFHLDLFKGMSVSEASEGDKPMPSDKTSYLESEDFKLFKYGTYIFNADKMRYDGLPVTPTTIEKESEIVNGMLTYIQYLPGEKRKVGEAWEFTKRIGKYDIVYTFKVESIVFRLGAKCAKIVGTCSLGSSTPAKDIDIMPADFTLWLSLDEGFVVSSRIILRFKTQSAGLWTLVEMTIDKKLASQEVVPKEKLAKFADFAVQISENERKSRDDKRDKTKDREIAAFFNKMLSEFGKDDPYSPGLTFVYDILTK